MNNIRRFPLEPTSVYYQPTAYNINCAGKPSYNAMPVNSQSTVNDIYVEDGNYKDGNLNLIRNDGEVVQIETWFEEE